MPSHYLTQCWDIINMTLGTNFSDILAEIITFSFKKMYLKVSSAKWRPFCFGLNVLNQNIKVSAFHFDIKAALPLVNWLAAVSNEISHTGPDDQELEGGLPFLYFPTTAGQTGIVIVRPNNMGCGLLCFSFCQLYAGLSTSGITNAIHGLYIMGYNYGI